jgi:uncharacterized protein (TIGR02145 family)
MKKLYTLLAFVITIISFAQAPQGFNYQATVRNSAGALIVNQNVNFKFNIMLNSASSLPVFSETHMTPTDDLGQVNLVIGTGTATIGTFSTINWGTGNYYLGIELNTGAGYIAMGTTQLLSVPYALYANSSGNAQAATPNLADVLAVNNGANNLQIKNLADPTEVQDAATKGYIDSQITVLQAQLNALQNLTVSSSVSQQTICTETSTQIGLTSNQTNATFTWSVSILTLPSNGTITGFSSGNGNLIVQTLSNTGSSAGVVRYIITPNLGSISGQPINVDVTVNPKPIISNKIITIDSGSSFIVTPQNIQGDIVPAGGTSYDWTVSNTTVVNGASNQFSYQSISQILTNITNIPQTVIYTVTPSTNNCIGTPFTITVTVNPPATPLQNVTIGTQIWCSTNLDVTTYRDGTPIPQVTDPTQLNNLTTGAWCYYNNDPANGAIYGKLYNWYAVAGIHNAASLNDSSLRKKLAPWGWHIPTKEELNTLTIFLGGPSVAGGKMKEIGTAHWNSPNTGANNESNFTGLPGGYYDANSANSSFIDKNTSGYWWSSSVAPPVQIIGYAWSIILTSNSNGVTISELNRAPDGLSVRLVKD